MAAKRIVFSQPTSIKPNTKSLTFLGLYLFIQSRHLLNCRSGPCWHKQGSSQTLGWHFTPCEARQHITNGLRKASGSGLHLVYNWSTGCSVLSSTGQILDLWSHFYIQRLAKRHREEASIIKVATRQIVSNMREDNVELVWYCQYRQAWKLCSCLAVKINANRQQHNQTR